MTTRGRSISSFFQEQNVVNPNEYISNFENMPYVVAVAAETMGIRPDSNGQPGISHGEFLAQTEAAISRYPVHAHETGIVSLAMLADSYIQDDEGRRVLRDHLARIGRAIHEAEVVHRTA
jgi:hypothetical protein